MLEAPRRGQLEVVHEGRVAGCEALRWRQSHCDCIDQAVEGFRVYLAYTGGDSCPRTGYGVSFAIVGMLVQLTGFRLQGGYDLCDVEEDPRDKEVDDFVIVEHCPAY